VDGGNIQGMQEASIPSINIQKPVKFQQGEVRGISRQVEIEIPWVAQ